MASEDLTAAASPDSGAVAVQASLAARASLAVQASLAARASLASANRIVIKIGTNTIMRKGEASGTARPGSAGAVDVEYLHHMASEVAALTRSGKQVIIVTSGAIGMGARELGIPKKVRELRMRQACAAIGQIALMDEYRRAFGVFGLLPAQLLVTRDAWDNRSAYLNLRASVETLLEAGAIPVFNENDVVSTAEIGNAFGDNDQLSAYVASKADAELLVILSDIDALYDADPRSNPLARPIPYVSELSPGIIAAAGGAGSEFSTGGMATKLKAVQIAGDAGCKVVIADGRLPGVISRILAGEPIGTLFDAALGLRNRQRWIKNSSPLGSLVIDGGALEAIRAKNSLLPRGIKAVEGSFERGDIVLLKLEGSGEAVAKIVSTLSSSELARVAGLRSGEVGETLGSGAAKVVARPEETVFLGEYPQ